MVASAGSESSATQVIPYLTPLALDWDRAAPGSRWRSIEGTLVFADISGFTQLSERLSRLGRVGAEELTLVLNQVFGDMLTAAFERGGSLLKFGGDALLLLFSTPDHVMQACAATVEMRAALRQASEQPTSVGRIKLRMSTGLHSGDVDFFLIGGSHRELIVTGPAATLATKMESAAGAGQIVVSADTRGQLPRDFTGAQVDSGWLLTKRKIDWVPGGLIARNTDDGADPAGLIPLALRERLASGIRDSEHRIATIGFIKFSGLDRLMADQGPPRSALHLHGLIRSVQDAADDEGVTFLASDIDADGGKIILATGVPASRYDDEGRMLRAIQRILAVDSVFSTKAGVNRGHVFSGDVGTALRRTYTVMGDAVNVAARLMAAAPVGSTYATSAVLDRSATLFRTVLLEPLHVKGKKEPLQAYAVFEELGVRPPELEDDLPFHGRDEALEEVVGIVNSCSWSGTGGMMTITGPTGLGKSRLIAEVLKRCPGVDRLVIQAEPNGTHNPYWAFRDPMRRLLGIVRAAQSTMVKELHEAIRASVPHLLPLTPLLGAVLHIEVPDNKVTSAIEPQFRPERTADAIVELLVGSCSRPVVIVVEDGQWLDEASLALLRRVGETASQMPWTVIVTARVEGDDYEVLGNEVELDRLADEAMKTIAIEATAAAPLRPHELDEVVAKADGSPLVLAEVLRVVRESGNADRLPDSIGALVATQIDTLHPLARQLLRYISVLGRSFSTVVLDRFLAAVDAHIDGATSEELSGFIDRDGEDRVRFRHSVVHKTAYEGLSYRKRRELHAMAGSVIEQLAGDDPASNAEALADHFFHAGEHGKSWHYSKIAAEKARRAFANPEAAAHYRHAISAAAHIEELDGYQIAEMWTRLGEVQDMAGQYEAARDAYSKAIRLGRSPETAPELYRRRAESWYGSGDLTQALRNITLGKRAAKAAPGGISTPAMARLDAYEASLRMARGEFAAAHAAAERAAATATEVGEDEALARAYYVLDGANFMLGRREERRGEEAIHIFERLGLTERSVAVMNNMGAFAYLEGRWDEAARWYEESLEAAEKSGDVFSAALTRANLAEVLIGQRRYEEAIPLLEQAERVFRASSAHLYMPLVRLLWARVKKGRGKTEGLIDDLQTQVAAQMGGNRTQWTEEAVILLSETLLEAGRSAKALEVLHPLEDETFDPQFVSSILRIRARALALQGSDAEARAALDAALERAVTAGDLYQEALVLEARAELQGLLGLEPHAGEGPRFVQLFDTLGISPTESQPVSTSS